MNHNDILEKAKQVFGNVKFNITEEKEKTYLLVYIPDLFPYQMFEVVKTNEIEFVKIA